MDLPETAKIVREALDGNSGFSARFYNPGGRVSLPVYVSHRDHGIDLQIGHVLIDSQGKRSYSKIDAKYRADVKKLVENALKES